MKKNELPIYDITQFEFKGNENYFYSNTISHHLAQHKHLVLAPHRHNFYLSVLFTRGSGRHEIEFNSYDINPGTVFTISPGEMHTWSLSKDIECYIIFHTREFFNLNFTYEKVENYPFFCCLRNSPVIVLPQADRQKIEDIFKEIQNEFLLQAIMGFQKICCLINILYISLSRKYLPKEFRTIQNHQYLGRLRVLEDQINRNFTEHKFPRDYARLMNLSEKHLNRICKSCLNKTVTEMIMDRIILEAKRLLAFSKMSVSEISTTLGYLDTAYFSRLFKKKTGKTTGEFIKEFHSRNGPDLNAG